ncbi:hypothetical protein AJ79_10172 [Helicocarpus griseus UAMH5409]|uniref:cellulase n=1 Tax=Helicocarpus griseus UAMH5409 TaxID=1447875 RepID=A0A2B7WFE2_9EURO|nr:hypothetical protein AJ79_10172 [Helicocarpus griseus UAMH5409]
MLFPADLPLSPLILPLLLLASPTLSQNEALSGSGVAERYWDCCKPDCSWPAKAAFNKPVATCNKRNEVLSDFSLGSACGGAEAYACADQLPWAVNDTFAYGFAGAFITQHASDFWCCACYELTFTSERLKGKKMVVQANNAAFDVTQVNRFPLAIPGGNTSYAGACARQYDVPNEVFGVDNRGIGSREGCDRLPESLRDGCRWRFDWFEDEPTPT